MNVDQIMAASEACLWLGARAGDMPEQRDKVVQMHAQLTLAALYLTEYAHHLTHGKDAYEALLATANGEMEIPEGPAKSVFELLRPRRT